MTSDPAEPARAGLDYALLKAEGIALIQELAGESWTDYNEHDPGVTTLEQLCYALTELSYRVEIPLADLLTDPRDGKIDARRQGMSPAGQILPCNPVTVDDYRKLLIDRVSGVGNAWVSPYRPHDHQRWVDGLYDVEIYVPGLDPCGCLPEEAPAAIRRRVRRAYGRHRNLCEDIGRLRILEPLRAVVHADLTIGGSQSPEVVLAEVFYRLGAFLAPEPRRVPLERRIDSGETADSIFDGPVLRRGFIGNDELKPRATSIRVADLANLMAEIPGVRGVRGVHLRLGDDSFGDAAPVPDGRIPQLDTRPEFRPGVFSIRIFRAGMERRPDPNQVRRALERLWSNHRRTYALGVKYDEYFGFPRGRYRDVRPYSSIQDQYPLVYGIGAYGLSARSSPARMGQARQLKGYLLVFDQLMSDYFAQLSRVRDLFCTDRGITHTYFWQSLVGSVPDLLPLLKKDRHHHEPAARYLRGMRSIVRAQDPFARRRGRFLDFLLALYADRLGPSSVWVGERQFGPDDGDEAAPIGAKRRLLRRLVDSTRTRGRGFDDLARPSRRNLAGMEFRCRIQLGMTSAGSPSPADLLAQFSLTLGGISSDATPGDSLAAHAARIEREFSHIGPGVPLSRVPRRPLRDRLRPITLLRGGGVTEEFLIACGDPRNYRVGHLPGERETAVVCKFSGDADWRLVARSEETDVALDAARALIELAGLINRHGRQLYIVEHTLLRFGRHRSDGRPGDRPGFRCDFTITAVIFTEAATTRDQAFQDFARGVIRQNTPAHIVANCLFLDLGQVGHFDRLYWSWRHALRHRRRHAIAEASRQLRRFIERAGKGSRRGHHGRGPVR